MNKIMIGIIASILALLVYVLGVILLAPTVAERENNTHFQEAEKVYKFNCIMCHGPKGRGDGPTAGVLPVAPPDWSNANWQSSVTDEGLKNAIVGGGTFIGRSNYMPSHPQLEDSPILEEMVKKIRTFGDLKD
jgi:mono/diheme cytochrome c family protein